MSDKLNQADPAATTPDDPKKDITPTGDCCVIPPGGGGDPGPGGVMAGPTES
jgi:hypothetical protein